MTSPKKYLTSVFCVSVEFILQEIYAAQVHLISLRVYCIYPRYSTFFTPKLHVYSFKIVSGSVYFHHVYNNFQMIAPCLSLDKNVF